MGTALSDASNVWFTIGHGILNEVFYPQVDTPAIKDFGFIVTNGAEYFSEESKQNSTLEWENRGVPAFKLINKSRDERYVIQKQIICDPNRPVVLQRVEFKPEQADNYHLYALLAPHLGDMGGDNNAWLEERNGNPLLVAERDGCFLVVASSAALLKRSVGFVGISDGWQDLSAHKKMQWEYRSANGGNVALTSEIDYSDGRFTLALAFGRTADEAIDNALESLRQPFDAVLESYKKEWESWLSKCEAMPKDQLPELAHISLATIKSHESKYPRGGLVAGLASPWGYAKGDDDKIGYHVIWTRDMVEAAGGLLAAGELQSAKQILKRLKDTQQVDGHWPQNMWVDGTPYWNGVQMDETALPILLVNMAKHQGALNDKEVYEFWPMVRLAAGYILRNGPVTQQDRWEEDPGYTPFTLATEVASLLAAADLADQSNEHTAAQLMRETADIWHDNIDKWLYTTDSEWCRKFGVSGYYERVASVSQDSVNRFQNVIHVKNVPDNDAYLKAVHLISPDALALVRFGLRSADDKRMLDTITVIDSLLKIDTPFGTAWHRYNDDGYGEHADGSAFDGTGIGRGWPLLTGERAHIELALGHKESAEKLKSDMEQFTGMGGLIPEQIWDSAPLPDYELELGRPTGSAMPLAWAHGEYLKLLRSIMDGQIFDRPRQTVKRYLEDKTSSNLRAWRFNHKIRTIPTGKTLRVETLAPATIHWTSDNWGSYQDIATNDSGLGVHFADLDTSSLPKHAKVQFTFYWHHADVWENRDFIVDYE